MKYSEVLQKINVQNIEANYQRIEKIHKVWPKPLSVGNFTKSFILHVSILLPFCKQLIRNSI